MKKLIATFTTAVVVLMASGFQIQAGISLKNVVPGAEKLEVDKLGRILLPTLLKEYAAITRDVMVIGAGDHFEIWDTKAWKEYASAHASP